jgi:hypothetical protein
MASSKRSVAGASGLPSALQSAGSLRGPKLSTTKAT